MSTAISIEQVTIERIDDIPLLAALQQRVGLPEVIDQIIPRHWLHQGLSLGQLVVGLRPIGNRVEYLYPFPS